MGGYGLYVWGSVGACAVALALEPLLVTRRQQTVMQSLRARARANKFDKEDRQ
jgi:heme exporter protein D